MASDTSGSVPGTMASNYPAECVENGSGYCINPLHNHRDEIITNYERTCIPGGCFDWSAVRKDYDGAPDAGPPSSLIGHGRTEAEAIADLLNQEDVL